MLSCLSQETMGCIDKDHAFGSEGVTTAFHSHEFRWLFCPLQLWDLKQVSTSQPVILSCKITIVIIIIIIV